MNNTWLHIYMCEEIPHKETISCTKVIEFTNVDKFLFKLKFKKNPKCNKRCKVYRNWRRGYLLYVDILR